MTTTYASENQRKPGSERSVDDHNSRKTEQF